MSDILVHELVEHHPSVNDERYASFKQERDPSTHELMDRMLARMGEPATNAFFAYLDNTMDQGGEADTQELYGELPFIDDFIDLHDEEDVEAEIDDRLQLELVTALHSATSNGAFRQQRLSLHLDATRSLARAGVEHSARRLADLHSLWWAGAVNHIADTGFEAPEVPDDMTVLEKAHKVWGDPALKNALDDLVASGRISERTYRDFTVIAGAEGALSLTKRQRDDMSGRLSSAIQVVSASAEGRDTSKKPKGALAFDSELPVDDDFLSRIRHMPIDDALMLVGGEVLAMPTHELRLLTPVNSRTKSVKICTHKVS